MSSSSSSSSTSQSTSAASASSDGQAAVPVSPFAPRLDTFKSVFSTLKSDTFSLDGNSPAKSAASASVPSSSASPGRSPSQAPVSESERARMTVAEYVRSKGGSNVITKILIANNGIAAVKAIRSIKKWAYETFGNDRMIEFVAMATPEDLKANAAYIHLADEFVNVPGGTNNNNYANVRLITEIAERTGAHAVWAGWGHASENPKLPEELAKTKNGVVWMGPPPSAMRALGDKIGSTLIAQSAQVPCMPWSGDGLVVDYAASGIPKDVYQSACVVSVAQAKQAADKIGYPLMIKASEGGGGKGIRRVTCSEDLDLAFPQVQGEVPGSPIFLMKLAPSCRHLEVQLLADMHGEAIAIHGRDCSIQRRHQKIIEEGPVVAAPKEIFRRMEQSAVRLAKEVGYIGAGTVEYLYLENGEYYFLELNPRLQVEHPVTELISGVNLPAAQLQVAMGIPLHLIRGVRRLYGEDPDTDTRIEFDTRERQMLPGHVIACRITAENPDNSFQPTSGVIQELNFRSTPDVWGYFSVSARGGVHEFSDSQFGHVFGLGETREIARRNMVLALKELSIRGDIRTTVEYLRKILETEDFKANRITTTWLEKVMAARAVTTEKPATHVAVLLGALFRSYRQQQVREVEYRACLDRGQMPSQQLFNDLIRTKLELIYEKTKYSLLVIRTGANTYELQLNQWNCEAEAHPLADDGLLVLLDGKKHVVYGQEFPSGLRLVVDSKTCLFAEEYDPTQLRAAMQGKLVRYLVADGAHVDKDKPYAEIEVMKMYVTLNAPESGTLRTVKPEGSVLEPGDLIASLLLDDPARVQKAELFTGQFPSLRPPISIGGNPSAIFQSSKHRLEMLLSGYEMRSQAIRPTLAQLMEALRDPRLPLEQFSEQLSTLTGRIPEPLYDDFSEILERYKKSISPNKFYWETPESFPVLDLQTAIEKQMLALEAQEVAKTNLNKNLAASGVTALLQHYKDGNHTYAASILVYFIEEFIRVESLFTDSRPEYVINALRKLHSGGDSQLVGQVARSHYQLNKRSELIIAILEVLDAQLAPLVSDFVPALRRLTAECTSRECSAVVLRARQLIMRQDAPSSQQRRIALQTILTAASQAVGEHRRERLAALVDQSAPIEDIIFTFFESTRPALSCTAMEAYIRRTFQAYSISAVDCRFEREYNGHLRGKWEFFLDSFNSAKSPRLSAPPKPQLTPADSVSNIAALGRALDAQPFSPSRRLSGSGSGEAALRQGVIAYFRDFDLLKRGFMELLSEFSSTASYSEPIHVFYVVCKWSGRLPSDDQMAEYFHTLLKGHESELETRAIRRVSFLVASGRDEHPLYFTFRHRLHFGEDTLCRHLEPSYAQHMQLGRLKNFDIRFVPTANRMVHLFAAYPAAEPGKGKTLHGVTKSPLVERPIAAGEKHDGRRLFVRSVIRKLDAVTDLTGGFHDVDLDAYPETEVAFVEALNALEYAIGGGGVEGSAQPGVWKFNCIFLNVLVEAVMDLNFIEAVIRMLARRYSEKLRRLQVALVEFACCIKEAADEQPKPYRFVCSNPTGHALEIEIYEERKDANGRSILHFVESDKSTPSLHSISSFSRGAYHGLEAQFPYQSETPLQRQREIAATMETVYVYDFIPLFQTAVAKSWHKLLKRSDAPKPGAAAPLTLAAAQKAQEIKSTDESIRVPQTFLTSTELILAPNPDQSDSYNPFVLEETKRSPGSNTIGMVAWKVKLFTPEYPEGRELILIANDITYQAGTFGPLEDYLFDLASKYARARGMPRIYLAANSGARIGLAEELRNKFQVAWIDDDPSKGLAYLYLSEADYAAHKASVNASPVRVNGETRYQISDIIGARDGLGVENLRGSGRIAGETSIAYTETFTLTYVTGRTVGIGAYLARLGQRCIQKASPPQSIILTGFNALNKLLGRQVYSSNVQLGGPEIMYTNGVSHQTVDNDMQGVMAILNWLSYIPAKRFERFSFDRVSQFSRRDPVSRLIEFRPPKTPHDPRQALAGFVDEATGKFVSGFFDRDSWTELLGGWAKSVIVGRGRLGGIPVGCIAVETRTIEQIIPADPASPDSKEQVMQRAGQVWYPDSAFKTASGIRDMIAEDIPLIIFANWRGFSGGMRDMFEEILKFGSLIVDALRDFRQPIIIYLPPNGTLRGGAWVVVDPTINPRYIQMFADQSARGGVLETEGTLDVKFRRKDILAQAHRLDKQLKELDIKLNAANDAKEKEDVTKQIRAREDAIFPLYHSAVTLFADLHDTPGRMKAKGCIDSIVQWETSREFFYWRILRRIKENELVDRVASALAGDWRAAQTKVNQFLQSAGAGAASDRQVAELLIKEEKQIEKDFLGQFLEAQAEQKVAEIMDKLQLTQEQKKKLIAKLAQ